MQNLIVKSIFAFDSILYTERVLKFQSNGKNLAYSAELAPLHKLHRIGRVASAGRRQAKQARRRLLYEVVFFLRASLFYSAAADHVEKHNTARDR